MSRSVFSRLAVVVTAAATAITVAACGSSSTAGSSSSSAAAATSGAPASSSAADSSSAAGSSSAGMSSAAVSGSVGTSASAAVTNKKVAVLTSGTANDGSWGQAVTLGAKAAAAKYGADVKISDNLDTPQQFAQLGSAFAQQGYGLVIIANGAAASVVADLSGKFPDVKFGGIAQNIPGILANARTVTPVFQETSFLAGVLAGKITKSKVVGTIGGFDFPVLDNEMEGFALGARYANPKVMVLRSFINSWTDATKGRAAAQAMISQKADIIFSATDQATQGMAQAMQAAGTDNYVITQYADDNAQAPKTILTSALYGLGDITGQFINQYLSGTWKSDNVSVGLSEIGGLAPYYGLDSVVPADAKAAVAATQNAIKKGCLKLPDSAALGKSGSADAIDVAALAAAAKTCS